MDLGGKVSHPKEAGIGSSPPVSPVKGNVVEDGGLFCLVLNIPTCKQAAIVKVFQVCFLEYRRSQHAEGWVPPLLRFDAKFSLSCHVIFLPNLESPGL